MTYQIAKITITPLKSFLIYSFALTKYVDDSPIYSGIYCNVQSVQNTEVHANLTDLLSLLWRHLP